MNAIPTCRRCGGPAPNETIIHNPLTEENLRYFLCDDCQFRLCKIMDLFVKGEDEE